ncbi:hypothetical protein THIOSC15_160008 [uncultured Thiomicrorhabdus sp.]
MLNCYKAIKKRNVVFAYSAASSSPHILLLSQYTTALIGFPLLSRHNTF